MLLLQNHGTFSFFKGGHGYYEKVEESARFAKQPNICFANRSHDRIFTSGGGGEKGKLQ